MIINICFEKRFLVNNTDMQPLNALKPIALQDNQ